MSLLLSHLSPSCCLYDEGGGGRDSFFGSSLCKINFYFISLIDSKSLQCARPWGKVLLNVFCIVFQSSSF